MSSSFNSNQFRDDDYEKSPQKKVKIGPEQESGQINM